MPSLIGLGLGGRSGVGVPSSSSDPAAQLARVCANHPQVPSSELHAPDIYGGPVLSQKTNLWLLSLTVIPDLAGSETFFLVALGLSYSMSDLVP